MPQPPFSGGSLGGNSADQDNPATSGAGVFDPQASRGFSFTGLISAIQAIAVALQQIVRVLGNSYVSLAGDNTFTGIQTFAQPIHLPVYALADLPAITLADVGALAFCSDGRNTGEGAAAGTGCTVQVQDKTSTATWCGIWSGIQVTA